MKKNVFLTLGSLLFILLLFECGARFFVRPSAECYGLFLGRKLPPETIEIRNGPSDKKSWYHKLIVNGQKITRDDLWGIRREDDLLGYTSLEDAVSVNGWWQSNALGALRRSEVSKTKRPDVRRMIAFGDSYTQCSRVPQEDSWPFYLEASRRGLEVINFGVDGYSMCQAYLRYTMLAKKVDHDVVILMFVPSVDLWRDLNVYRGFWGWGGFFMPRFVISENRLKLIPSPYKSGRDFFEDNRRGPSDRFKAHVRAYDRFYFQERYEIIPVIGHSILYKLFVRLKYDRSALLERLKEPDSEAIRISKKIFEKMNADVQKSGADFVLLILPTHEDILKYKKNMKGRKKWEKMVAAVVGKDIKYVDLMRGFKNAPEGQRDKGYDGTHYGPRANQLIAELISSELGL